MPTNTYRQASSWVAYVCLGSLPLWTSDQYADLCSDHADLGKRGRCTIGFRSVNYPPNMESPRSTKKKMRCVVPLCWPTPRGDAWRLLWSPTSPGLVYNLEAQQQVWGDLGTDACITLALHFLDLIGCKCPSAAKSAALSEGQLGANGGYSKACPTRMLPSGNFVGTGVYWCAGRRSSARL